MTKIFKTTSGAAALLMASSSFGHPGHTIQLIHSHEHTTLGVAAVVVASVVAVGVYVLRRHRKQQQAKD